MVYVLAFDSIVEDYIEIDDSEFSDIAVPCTLSAFQHLNKAEMTVTTSDEGGIEFPDFYYKGSVPLFSESLFELIDSPGLFVKPINVVCKATQKKVRYMMALPARIDCMDRKKSVYETIEPEDGFETALVSKLVIDETRLGRYKLFKLDKVLNNDIFITEDIKKKLEAAKPEGLSIYGTDEVVW